MANTVHTKKLKIVPRFVFEGWSGSHYHDLLTYTDQQKDLANQLYNICSEYGFDGLVLDAG